MMAPRLAITLMAIAVAVGSVSGAPPSTIRGLDPALDDSYRPSEGGLFRCLDGKKGLPYDQLNDDYCDCFDGSDEPGESELDRRRCRARPPAQLAVGR